MEALTELESQLLTLLRQVAKYDDEEPYMLSLTIGEAKAILSIIDKRGNDAGSASDHRT